ncbi:hypothetical protein MTO96_031593 [Rhipicephalus appendiculatus]
MRGLISAVLVPGVGPFMRRESNAWQSGGSSGRRFHPLPAVAGVGVGPFVLCRTRNQMRSAVSGAEALWGLRSGPVRQHLL